MTELLKDKVCVVTGAGKGIGLSISKVFIENGAKLAVITRSQEDADSLNAQFKSENSNSIAICGDVSEQDVVNRFIGEVVDKYGCIDVLINNAGMRFRKKFEDITSEDFRKVLDVNLLSVFFLCQAVIPIMLKQNEGKIINMSSIAGTQGFSELSGYVTSKAAIIGLTKSLAVEYAKDNIQVNALAPGFCKTSYFDNFAKNNELYDFTIDRTPMQRWGESIEVANTCLFLASSLSSYITGDVISVDGGWSAA